LSFYYFIWEGFDLFFWVEREKMGCFGRRV